jgi:hypothetical protein
MRLRFSQHIFHSDQFGYAKHARTQIDLNKQKLMQSNLGTESTRLIKIPFVMDFTSAKIISQKTKKRVFLPLHLGSPDQTLDKRIFKLLPSFRNKETNLVIPNLSLHFFETQKKTMLINSKITGLFDSKI